MSETANLIEQQFHLPFDQYQRYKLVTDALEKLRRNDGALKVLDVGGAEGTILKFLDRDRVSILDQTAAEGVPGFVQGDATALPFEDGAFDYVTSVDTFEHIAPQTREKYLSELRRVAGKGVLLAGPFAGGGVQEAEALASEFFRSLYGGNHKWLEEHEEHGLPQLDETRTFYEKLGDSITVLPNGYLLNWLVMICLFFHGMKLKGELHQLSQRANHFYNRFLYEYDNAEPCYRYLVVALKESAPVELGDLTSPPADPDRASLTSALVGSFTSTLPLVSELRTARVQSAQKDAQILDLSRRLANHVARTNAQHALQQEAQDNAQLALQQENQRLKHQRNQLRDRLEAITNSRTWRIVGLLGKLRRLGR
jgi:ubiquinone/menaquinone biosynthesis C-methylase UbiE/FtsZ-binding cell division protein ZapB